MPDRFWSKVDLSDPEGCWPWRAATDQHGYGRFNFERKNDNAHRIAYMLAVGPLAPGLVIDHLCRNRLCQNPDHLRQTTHRENILTGVGQSAIHAAKTHCIHGHKLSGDNLAPAPQSHWRRCRTCKNAAERERYNRKKEVV